MAFFTSLVALLSVFSHIRVGQKLPRGQLFKAAFGFDYNFAVGHIVKKRLSAVAAGREDFKTVIFANDDGNYTVKLALAARQRFADGDRFGARAVQSISVYAGVNLPVFAP